MRKSAPKTKEQTASSQQPVGFFIQGVSAKGTSKGPVPSSAPKKSAVAPKAVSNNNKPGVIKTQQKNSSSNVISNQKKVEPAQKQNNNGQPNKQNENTDNAKKIEVIHEVASEEKKGNVPDQQQPKEEIVKQEEIVKKEPVLGKVVVKYNHYNDSFDIVDGKLKFSDIDERYYFSFVFKGEYTLKLKHIPSKEQQISNNKIFESLVDGQIYEVGVSEDPAEVAKEVSKPYYAPSKDQDPLIKKKNNTRIDDLTNELKGMSIEELKQKGDKYKEIIEARDLEDCLYN